MLISRVWYDRLSQPQQYEVSDIILACEEWAAANRTPLSAVLVAALANGYGESRLQADAVGDGGKAFGVFQMNTGSSSALGSVLLRNGWQVQDFGITYNTCRAILWEASKSARFMDAVRVGSPARATWFFCVDAERPRNAEADAATRVGFARQIVERPEWADWPAPDVDRLAWPDGSRGGWVDWGSGAMTPAPGATSAPATGQMSWWQYLWG